MIEPIDMLRAGLCVLPAIKEQKRPAFWKWREFQEHLPEEPDVLAWTPSMRFGACIVCGKVSGGLECMDFDSGGIAFRPWQQLISPELGQKLVCEQTPSGGFHVVFRSSCAEGNQKLALDANKKVLIETRGEGGLFLCDPTPDYKLIQNDWKHVPTLTPEERATLFDAARSFDHKQEHIAPPPKRPMVIAPRELETPADVYAKYGDIPSLLVKHGWTLVHEGRQQLWRRPGKTEGTSATFNGSVFYVFSTNAFPFEGNKGYSKFSVLAMLDFNGDMSAASAAVREEMLAHNWVPNQASKQSEPIDVDISEVIAKNGDVLAKEDDEPSFPPVSSEMPEECYECGGFIEELCAYSCRTTPYPNRPIAFAGALAMMSMLAGRRYQTISGLSPNIYVLALAESGAGKDRPRQVNFELAASTGLGRCIGDSFISGAGLEDALVSQPNKLFQADEISFLFANMRENDRVANEMVATLLKLYSASNSVLYRRAMAARSKKDKIEINDCVWRPNFVLFGTATPGKFYGSLTADSLENGLAGRVLVFEGAKRQFIPGASCGEKFPEHVLDTISEITELDQTGGVLTNGMPTPIRIPESPDASNALVAIARDGDRRWNAANEQHDSGAMSIWARVPEKTYKLAALRAVSIRREGVRIDVADVDWGRAIAISSAELLIEKAKAYVAEDDFDKKRLSLLRKLREHGGEMNARTARRSMHLSSKNFKELLDTLQDNEQVKVEQIKTSGRPILMLRLVT